MLGLGPRLLVSGEPAGAESAGAAGVSSGVCPGRSPRALPLLAGAGGAVAGLGALLAIGQRCSQFLATWQLALQASRHVLGVQPVPSAVGLGSGAWPARPAPGGPSPPSVGELRP